MSNVRIPERVVPGLNVIASLNQDELNNIVDIISKFKVSNQAHILFHNFSDIIESNSAHELLKTLLSFSELAEENDSSEIISKKLIASYAKYFGEEYPIDYTLLEKNLNVLLAKYEPLRLHTKFHSNYSDNVNNFLSAKVNSDIKLIRDKGEIYTAVLSTLKILYIDNQNDSEKNLYLSLDFNELKSLQNIIEEAIHIHEETIEKFETNML